MRKGLLRAAALAIMAPLHAASVVVLALAVFAATPNNPGGGQRVVRVHKGQSFAAAAQSLERQGIIARAGLFRLMAVAMGGARRVKAGEYLLSPAMPPARVLAALVEGKTLLYKYTVPEGFTMGEAARLAEEEGFCPAVDFPAVCSDKNFLKLAGVPAPSAEGYLFPETYHFPKPTPARTLAETMLKRFHAVFDAKKQARAKELGMTMHQAVTLASIIEKETGAGMERAMVSSVFHNRLAKGMRLDSDPTVIYGIPGFQGNLTRCHLETPTAYNTYKITGLPPGPICNPGEAALAAALYPAASKYLYFVSQGNGAHAFSLTLEEHNRAVRRFQKTRSPAQPNAPVNPPNGPGPQTQENTP
jgi:UPF0755 protein